MRTWPAPRITALPCVGFCMTLDWAESARAAVELLFSPVAARR